MRPPGYAIRSLCYAQITLEGLSQRSYTNTGKYCPISVYVKHDLFHPLILNSKLKQGRRRRRHLKCNFLDHSTSFLQNVFKYSEMKLVSANLEKVENLLSCADVFHITAAHVISSRGKNANGDGMYKNENCTFKACKSILFIVT